MERLEIDNILNNILISVKAHELETGKYCRWTNRHESYEGRDYGWNAYGCADAANILYTLNCFPRDIEERKKWIDALQKKQDSQTGIFYEGTHHEFHTTAHCVAALELFDARPMYSLFKLEKYKDINEFYKMCEDVDWLHCGKAAHPGAGLYAALVITEMVDDKWVQEYFSWFNENCDGATGVWARQPVSNYPVYTQIGDAFHFLFNYDHAKEPIPYPDKLIDFCLNAYRNGKMPEKFGKQFHFIEMDWVYCLNRASRQTDHRFNEVKEVLYEFAKSYVAYLENVDWEYDGEANDIHLLFGTICCLAELQLALPGKIHSSRPLRLVLDRRPFI